MKVTRRKLARVMVTAAALAAAAGGQNPPRPGGAEGELEAARASLRAAARRMASFPLPMTTEPAVHFRA